MRFGYYLFLMAMIATMPQVNGFMSLVSYGACQTACNAGVVTCYSAAGLTFGAATFGAAMPAAAVACSTAQGTCMAACSTKFLAEASAETAASGGLMGPAIAVGGVAMSVIGYFWS